MKKTILTTTFFFFLIFFSSGIVNSQWQDPVRLTNSLGGFNDRILCYNYSRPIVSDGGYVYVVWSDPWWGNPEIYFIRSTNNGVSWGQPVRLTNNSAVSDNACIASYGGIVHVIWTDYRDGNPEIYYKRSGNSGATWGSDTRLTNNPANSGAPSVVVSGNNVHLVWRDTRDGSNYDGEIYYKRSTNGGVSWGADTRLTNIVSSKRTPSIVSNGNYIHIVWGDERNSNEEIYYKRSTDGGSSWGSDTRFTNNTGSSEYPNITASGLNVYVFWHDDQINNKEIWYKRSTNWGATWGAETRLTTASNNSLYPVAAASGSNVHLVWKDSRDGGYFDTYYKLSTNGGATWGADIRLHYLYGFTDQQFITTSYQTLHLVYRSRLINSTTYHIDYERNPTGNPTGINNINSEIPENFNLSQNFPNPFNPTTNINFSIPKSGHVKLVVYDITGKIVAELVNGNYSAGTYKIDFDASKLSSGTYFYRIEAGEFTSVRKMTLVK